MSKASDIGASWLSGLKFKQWLQWFGGDGALPDKRSRKIMCGTVALVVLLMGLGWVALAGGGGSGHHPPAQSATNVANLPPQLLNPLSTSTTTTTTTTTTTAAAAQGTAAAKRTHPHAQHTAVTRPQRRVPLSRP